MPNNNYWMHRIILWCIIPFIVVLLLSYPLLLSGFEEIPGDLGDARFNHLILEHTYSWILGEADLWSPMFFFPAKNIAAYSDILLGVAPFYWLWRLIGIDPLNSYGLWLLTISILNYVLAVTLFSVVFKNNFLSVAIASLLFAASSVKVSLIVHPQLLFQGYFILAVLSLCKIFSSNISNGKCRSTLWILILFASLVLQLYASFYVAWSLLFLLVIAFLVACCSTVYREKISLIISTNFGALLFGVLISILCVFPLIYHYRGALSEVGYRQFSHVHGSLPTFVSWINNGPFSVVYGWMHDLSAIGEQPMEHEKRLGIGIITAILAISGLWRYRKVPAIKLLGLTFVLAIFVITSWPGGVQVWNFFYLYFPGAAAIRAVGRIGILLSLVYCLGVGLYFQNISRSRIKGIYILLLVSAILLEQIQLLPSFGQTMVKRDLTAIVTKIEKNRERCRSFLLLVQNGKFEDYKYQLDAMWAAYLTKIPTLNGYSGNVPPGWKLDKIRYSTLDERSQILDRATEWAKLSSLPKKSICIIDKRFRDGKVSHKIKLL